MMPFETRLPVLASLAVEAEAVLIPLQDLVDDDGAVLARIDRDLAGRSRQRLAHDLDAVFWLSFLVRMPFRCSEARSRATPPLREVAVSLLWHASYDRDSMAKAVDSTIGGGALSGLSGKKAQAIASDQAWQQFRWPRRVSGCR
jgi:hypothetical protein